MYFVYYEYGTKYMLNGKSYIAQNHYIKNQKSELNHTGPPGMNHKKGKYKYI